MSEMKNKWLKNREYRHVLICIVLLIIINVTYFFARARAIEASDLRHIQEDDFSFCYQIEAVEIGADKVEIGGWAFKLKQNSSADKLKVCLYDSIENRVIRLKSDVIVRKDVNDYFFCDYDYSYSGFNTTIEIDELDLLNKQYEIMLSFDEYGSIYKTNIFLTNDGLENGKAKEKLPIEVVGTQLEEVVLDGYLLISDKDTGLYIYQYESKLYMVFDEKYIGRVNEETYMPVHMYTSQPKKLPAHMRELDATFDNRDYWFCDRVVHIENSEYCMAIVDMEADFSITWIDIGDYSLTSGEWTWQKKIRPYYSLKD